MTISGGENCYGLGLGEDVGRGGEQHHARFVAADQTSVTERSMHGPEIVCGWRPPGSE